MLLRWAYVFFVGFFLQEISAIEILMFKIKQELHHEDNQTVCYKRVACFTTGAPFMELPHRPVPAPEDPEGLGAYVNFYDRKKPDDGHTIFLSHDYTTNQTSFDAKRKYTIFIAGCYNDSNALWQRELKDAFLKKTDANVFIFGTQHARTSVLQNFSNLRTLSALLARYIKHLQTDFDLLTEENLWLVGFGCGAHMCGYVGRAVIVNRITGLDPTNFLFEGTEENVRLGRIAAIYVDVHHTDASHIQTRHGVGYVQPIGHVDFYYNGGFKQPGCPIDKSLLIGIENYENCDHARAVEYFKQAILLHGDGLYIWGRNVTTMNYINSQSDDGKDGVRLVLAALLRGACNHTACIPVGFDSPKSSIRGIQVVTTMPYPPWYSTVDQADDQRFGQLFFDQVVTRWLHTMVPQDGYFDPPVRVLPRVKPACYHSFWGGRAGWTLGCFNMSAPWDVMKNRPISPPDPPGQQRIQAWFYSRQNWNNKFKMELYPRVPDPKDLPFDSRRMTFMIIHGFYNSASEPWIAPFKDGLLNRSDCNVIVAEWGGGAVTLDYLQASGNLRLAARSFSNMLQYLINHKGLNVTHLHLIGHSMGAPVAGFIGKSIPGIFQITVLDPAQAWFIAADKIARIDKSDANFVVAVHSDAPPFLPDLGFGLPNEVGHIDFYINGGFKQPKCVVPSVEMVTPNFTNILDLVKPISQIFVKLVLCPHQAAVDVFTEAVTRQSCIFWGQAIRMDNMIASSHLSTDGLEFEAAYFKAGIDHECTPQSCSPLGLDTYFWPARGTFIIMTRSTAPHCIYESHVKTLQKSLMTTVKSRMIANYHEEFHPQVNALRNKLSPIALPDLALALEVIDFEGLILFILDIVIRPLFEIMSFINLVSDPIQGFFILFWNNVVTKLAANQSQAYHKRLLLNHVQEVEKKIGMEKDKKKEENH